MSANAVSVRSYITVNSRSQQYVVEVTHIEIAASFHMIVKWQNMEKTASSSVTEETEISMHIL